MIRVLLVDDEPLLRMAFTMVLDAQPDMRAVGEAGDGTEAVRLARQLTPDVVLMDVRMPGTDGIEATGLITGSCPDTRVLILTTFDLDEYAFAGLRAGASGFLLKNALPEELLAAIRHVAAGDAIVAPRVTRRLLDHFAHRLPARGPLPDERLERLTPREREVLIEVARGLSNTEIAATLHLAEATVKTHLSRILPKLGLRDRVQAVVFAYETRLVQPAYASPVLTEERAAEIDSIIGWVAGWATGRADVVGLLLVGSVARGAARPDSDVDLILLTEALADYADPGWAAELDLGEPIRVQTWGVITEHRFQAPSGLEIEIGLGTPDWAKANPVDPGTRRVVTDGSRILHDPHRVLATLRDACGSGYRS